MEFLTEVATPLISAAGAIIVCLVNNRAQMRKRDIEQDKHITEIKNELNEQLTSVKTELHEQIMELSAAYQQSVAVIGCQIEALDRKQEIHNKVIERVYKLENKGDVIEEKIKVANNRIADLERRQA